MGEELLRKNSATQVHLMSLECNKNPSRWIKDDERGAPDKCPVKYLVDLIMWTHSVSVCVFGVWGVCCGVCDCDEVREKGRGRRKTIKSTQTTAAEFTSPEVLALF